MTIPAEYNPLNYVIDDGDLTISTVPMRCPAWAVTDLTALWVPADLRGANRVLPGAQGVIINPKRKTSTRRTLTLVVTGAFTIDGTPASSEWQGLRDNLAYLTDNVFDPPSLPLVSRSAVLTDPDGGTSTAQVQVLSISQSKAVNAIRVYTVDIELPQGEFA